MTDPLVALATYLTDNRRVAFHSVCLQLDGRDRLEAEDFFTLRASYGVAGYMTSSEALVAIQDTIAMSVCKVPDAGS